MIFNECCRLYFIIRVVFNYGLIECIPKNKLVFPLRMLCKLFFWIPKKKCSSLLLGERLRLAFQELGPIWIKFGQMISTRRDIFSSFIVDQLSILQDRVEPSSSIFVKSYIENVIGESLDNWFDDFQENPLASASISQVYTAKLKKNGKEVIIKLIRPDIIPIIKSDIKLMYRLAYWIPKFFSNGKRLRSVEVVWEYEKMIFNELNLLSEMSNTIQLRRNFEGSSILYVPEVYPDYCNKNMIVMERVYGISVHNIIDLRNHGIDMKLLAERGLQIFFTQVFRDSFFHGDMHPGNVFVSYHNPNDPQYISIDCGIMGSLNKKDKYYLAANFLAFLNRDYRRIAELHVFSGWTPVNTNIDDFEDAIRIVFEPLFKKSLDDISFSYILLNLFNTARRFNMEVQPKLVLLQKSLLYIESMVRRLYPKLDLWKVVKPFLESWLSEQTNISVILSILKENTPYWIGKFPEFPELVYDVFKEYKVLHNTIHLLIRDLNIRRVRQGQAWFFFAIGFTLIFVGMFLLVEDSNKICMLHFFYIFIGFIMWFFGLKKIF